MCKSYNPQKSFLSRIITSEIVLCGLRSGSFKDITGYYPKCFIASNYLHISKVLFFLPYGSLNHYLLAMSSLSKNACNISRNIDFPHPEGLVNSHFYITRPSQNLPIIFVLSTKKLESHFNPSKLVSF